MGTTSPELRRLKPWRAGVEPKGRRHQSLEKKRPATADPLVRRAVGTASLCDVTVQCKFPSNRTGARAGVGVSREVVLPEGRLGAGRGVDPGDAQPGLQGNVPRDGGRSATAARGENPPPGPVLQTALLSKLWHSEGQMGPRGVAGNVSYEAVMVVGWGVVLGGGVLELKTRLHISEYTKREQSKNIQGPFLVDSVGKNPVYLKLFLSLKTTKSCVCSTSCSE